MIKPKTIFYKIAGAAAAILPQLFSSVAYAVLSITDPKDISSKILCPIAAAMFWILIALSSIMVIWAAFLYLTAAGESEKVSKAHKTLAYAAVAVVVALLAKGFPVIVASLVGGEASITTC